MACEGSPGFLTLPQAVGDQGFLWDWVVRHSPISACFIWRITWARSKNMGQCGRIKSKNTPWQSWCVDSLTSALSESQWNIVTVMWGSQEMGFCNWMSNRCEGWAHCKKARDKDRNLWRAGLQMTRFRLGLGVQGLEVLGLLVIFTAVLEYR